MAVGAVLAAWVTEMAIDTFESKERVPPGLPVPSIYLADMILFGALAFGAKESAKAAPVITLLAWGIVIATLVNGGNSLANVLITKGTALGGTAAAPSSNATGTVTTPNTQSTSPTGTGPVGFYTAPQGP